MSEYTDLKKLSKEFDEKIAYIRETLEVTEWMIKHFGEAWPEDVRGHISREKEEQTH